MTLPQLLKVGIVLAMGLLLLSCTGNNQLVPEGCITGVLTDQGDTCQALKSHQNNKTYSFYTDMNGYSIGEEVCVCGKVSQMTTCKTGTPIDVMHLDRTCPATSKSTNQFVFPLD